MAQGDIPVDFKLIPFDCNYNNHNIVAAFYQTRVVVIDKYTRNKLSSNIYYFCQLTINESQIWTP